MGTWKDGIARGPWALHRRGRALLFLAAIALTGRTTFAAAPDAAGFRQPAEFEPQAGIWMGAEPENPEFMHVTAQMTKAFLPHVAVNFLLRDDASLTATREGLRRDGVPIDSVTFFVDSLATFFCRDATLFLTSQDGRLGVLDLKWSLYGLPGWCWKLHPDEPERATKCASYANDGQDALDLWFAESKKAAVIPTSLYLENACIEVNGKGVLLITEPLALERNPGRSRAQIEAALLSFPGVTKVIWLANGLAEDPLEMSTIDGDYVGLGAGGHTDEYIRFADASTILLAWVDESRVAEHPLNRINHERMQANYDILAASTDQDGKPFRLVKIPMPSVLERKVKLVSNEDESSSWTVGNFPASEGRKAGDEVTQVAAASYLNLVIANELVLVPSFVQDGTPREVEEQVRDLLSGAFPGRAIEFLRVTPLNWNGGGPHCATLSEPRVR